MTSYHLDHLAYLESEAIHVLREVAAEFERPCLLFSGGKDSVCLLRLAEKAFRPADLPMPLLNIDTGHHFPELNEFRDLRAKELGARLIIRKGEERHCQRHGGACSRGGQPQPLADSNAAARHRGISLRCLHRRRAARRGKSPRQGTLLQFSRPFRPVGPQEPASRNLEPLQRPRPPRRAYPSVSAQQLDGAGCVGVHPPGKTGRAAYLFQPPAQMLPTPGTVVARV